jgi:hypothetical protein
VFQVWPVPGWAVASMDGWMGVIGDIVCLEGRRCEEDKNFRGNDKQRGDSVNRSGIDFLYLCFVWMRAIWTEEYFQEMNQ